ncbi:hypothetical protein [Vibrio barjaei]|uniref:hypothetical protein n=1 Tax=Vibrio barjaei TaxID=1676683 RepID=UPI002283E8F6|nr:hypothetical protein [Vibrio barjaei]MCY9872555.1 hypothetical protein [Vibrio barjaei]
MFIDRRYLIIFSLIVFFSGIYILFSTQFGVVNTYSPVPYWDQWDGYLQFYTRLLDGDYSAWWYQHNEHRIIFSRLLFYIDLRFFGGESKFLLVANSLLQLVNVGLMMYIVKDMYVHNKMLFFVIFGLVLSFAFSWLQQNNLTWGFQSQFIAVYTFSLLSLIMLSKYHQSHKKTSLVFTAGLLGAMSAYSMSNGLIALPLMILMAVMMKLSAKHVLTLLAITILVWFAYFYNYTQPPGHASVTDSILNHPFEVLKFTMLYLGAPIYYMTDNVLLAHATGVIFLIACVICLIRFFVYDRKNYTKLVLLVFLLLIGGTALGTATGRINFGYEMAFSSRYITPTLLAWSSLFILLILTFGVNEKTLLGYFLFALFMSFGLIPEQEDAYADYSEMKFNRRMAILSLRTGANEEQYTSQIFPFKDWLIDIAKDASEKKISIFDSESNSFKENIFEYGNIQSCMGNNEDVFTLENGYLKLKGWVYNGSSNVVDLILLANLDGEVIGEGIAGKPRPDVKAVHGESAINSGWYGYTKTKEEQIFAYALYRDGYICKVNALPFATYSHNY